MACSFSTSQLPKVFQGEFILAFWLPNVLPATTACAFSTSQLPKVIRGWGILAFWLHNVLRATSACAFSTSQLPNVLRGWSTLCILTSKRASCDNAVNFFNISSSKSDPNNVFCTFWLRNVLRAIAACNFSSHKWLRTRRFSEPTFRPATKNCKTLCFATFSTFLRTCIFFRLTVWLFLFSDLLSCDFLFSDSSQLFFSICPYCWKFDF